MLRGYWDSPLQKIKALHSFCLLLMILIFFLCSGCSHFHDNVYLIEGTRDVICLNLSREDIAEWKFQQVLVELLISCYSYIFLPG